MDAEHIGAPAKGKFFGITRSAARFRIPVIIRKGIRGPGKTFVGHAGEHGFTEAAEFSESFQQFPVLPRRLCEAEARIQSRRPMSSASAEKRPKYSRTSSTTPRG